MCSSDLAQILQAQGMGGGGGAGGPGVEPIKPKIDVNVELMMIKKMLAKICDALNIHIPASDMAVNSQDLTNMAMQQGGQGTPQQQSAIQPISPIQPAAPGMGKTSTDREGSVYTEPFDSAAFGSLEDKASAIGRMFSARQKLAN